MGTFCESISVLLLTDGKVPQFDSFVVTARDDEEVVELETGDPIGMRSEGDEALARVERPHLDRLVVGGRHEAPRVRLQTSVNEDGQCGFLFDWQLML